MIATVMPIAGSMISPNVADGVTTWPIGPRAAPIANSGMIAGSFNRQPSYWPTTPATATPTTRSRI
jgi:hypothetical protein